MFCEVCFSNGKLLALRKKTITSMKTKYKKPMFKTWPLLTLPTELHFYFTLKYLSFAKKRQKSAVYKSTCFVFNSLRKWKEFESQVHNVVKGN